VARRTVRPAGAVAAGGLLSVRAAGRIGIFMTDDGDG
jgi:hypothetical protein